MTPQDLHEKYHDSLGLYFYHLDPEPLARMYEIVEGIAEDYVQSHELAAYKRMGEEIKKIYDKPGVEYTFNGIAIRDDIDQALERLSKEVGNE